MLSLQYSTELILARATRPCTFSSNTGMCRKTTCSTRTCLRATDMSNNTELSRDKEYPSYHNKEKGRKRQHQHGSHPKLSLVAPLCASTEQASSFIKRLQLSQYLLYSSRPSQLSMYPIVQEKFPQVHSIVHKFTHIQGFLDEMI